MSAGAGGVWTAAIGAVSDAYSAYQQGKIARIGYALQESTARRNQEVAGWNADDALKRGRWAQSVNRKKTKALQGTQRANMAASGVDLTQGSPLHILTDTDYMGALDDQQLADNAQQEASAYRLQAAGLIGDAAMAQMAGSAANPGGAAAGSLLTGATQVAQAWYRYKKGEG